jgi:hypothetical protein
MLPVKFKLPIPSFLGIFVFTNVFRGILVLGAGSSEYSEGLGVILLGRCSVLIYGM